MRIDKMQSNVVCSFGIWSIRDDPSRPLPDGQNLHSCLALFQTNYDVFGMLCENKLEICTLPNLGVLNLNLIVKRDECVGKSFCFDISVRSINFEN